MTSRVSGLHRLGIHERIDALCEQRLISHSDAELLKQGQQVLLPAAADRFVENVVGTFGLPFAIAPNFIVNGRECLVPLVVEEPSVVAALSNAAKIARAGGGFTVAVDDYWVTGQIHLVGVDNVDAAMEKLTGNRASLIERANQVQPNLIARGGGVRDIEFRSLQLADGRPLLVLHVQLDAVDAMGANLVNTVCEAIAPDVSSICGGEIAMRILTNLADRSIFTARMHVPLADLGAGKFTADEVRDRIVLASDIAIADPYRAATHNKGIMNGIDSLAIATGNDWRAIEAGAHAFASLGESYQPLAIWSEQGGDLHGEIRLPLRVGTVGGTVTGNAGAALGLRMTGVDSARELGALMAAVGLAQNFAAIRALATDGIQAGHMRLHRRQHQNKPTDTEASIAAMPGRAAAKVILVGEHAAVYGSHVLALPIADAMGAEVSAASGPLRLAIPDWGVEVYGVTAPAADLLAPIFSALDVAPENLALTIRSRVPRGMGLGSSAALAVAVVRALAAYLQRDLDDETVNQMAFECERIAHGTPSGVDNALATFAKPLLVKNDGALAMQALEVNLAPPLVVAFSSQMGSTRQQVAGVRERYDNRTDSYAAIFEQIDALSLQAATALGAGNWNELGALMNVCHGLLTAIEVSTPELERMVHTARRAGATGAKLTGGGGGGSIIALCPNRVEDVVAALENAGYGTLVLAGEE
ncbi:MAG: hydroxymethylglutaryl-CoA reductase, degradative [Pseudomonadota bacterium]